MTNFRKEDLSLTLEVLRGKREPVENHKTWLRHKADSEAGQIDLQLLNGASKPEMARTIPCREQRVQDHFNHLEEGPSTMEPHHLKLKSDRDGRWSFDEAWIAQQVEDSPGNPPD